MTLAEEEKDIKELSDKNLEMNAIIEQFANLNKDNQRYIDDLNMDVTNLKISVSSFDESEASIDEMVERINQDINNNNLSIDNKIKQKAPLLRCFFLTLRIQLPWSPGCS